MADHERAYLQTDLGHTSLFDAVAEGRKRGGEYSANEAELWRSTIAALPEVQIRGGEGLDGTRCFPSSAFDRQNVLFDLHYFKYCFLMTSGAEYHEVRLEEDFEQMAADLTEEHYNTFMYRDFQSRNVMLVDGRPHFIDYQGGRPGPMEYDVASFLWQASAQLPDELRQNLIDTYLDAHERLRPIDRATFRPRLMRFVLLRMLQVLGAYGFRGGYERKRHFIDSIPPAVASLSALLDKGVCTPYPYLESVLRRMVALPRFATKGEEREEGLHVKVYSFSYKKGIPEDTSGNGGGYVFDCRAVHNPGRYDRYKPLTGLDRPVIDFLEADGEIADFLAHARALADSHVARYIERGFTSLMLCFGCTGGRHRSVYSARHMAEYIHSRYGIRVSLCHREQGITQEFPPTTH